MEYYQVKVIDSFHFKFKCTEFDIQKYFTYTSRGLVYNYRIRRYVYNDLQYGMFYYPDKRSEIECESQFLIGMASYIYGMFYDKLDNNSRELLANMIFAPDLHINRADLSTLTDEQFNDI